jgi:hypothetical protein
MAIRSLQEEKEVTLRLTVSQSVIKSVSMSWYRAPLWDLRPDITSCRNVTVRNLRPFFCGAPSLTRGRVCRNYFTADGYSVSMTLYRAPL